MANRPYDRATREAGHLRFLADLPAFAAIGRRYDAIERAYVDFSYRLEYVEGWKEFVGSVQDATADVLAGRRPWPEVAAGLEARYPDRFPGFRDRMPTWVLKDRGTPEGLKTYLEWLAQNTRLALNAVMIYATGDLKTLPRPTAYLDKLARERAARLPPGRYAFLCGDRDAPTAGQEALFDWLEANQEEVAARVEDEVRSIYGWLTENLDVTDPHVQVLCPPDASDDAPLDRTRIDAFHLAPCGRRIGLAFLVPESYFEEHGCALVIEDGVVGPYGGGEELFAIVDDGGDEESDEEDEP